MSADYHERQATTQLKKAHAELARSVKAEDAAAGYDKKALRADKAASTTSSETTRRTRQREADSARRSANDQRTKAAAAKKAAAAAQAKAEDHHRKAAAVGARKAKRERDQAERDARNEAVSAARRESLLRGEIEELQTRSGQLEALIEESRKKAPRRIKVLLMSGTPEGGVTPLRIDQELREIELKMRGARYRDHVELRATHATRVDDVMDALNHHGPDVVHFSGHGGSGVLLFDGADGAPVPLEGEYLADMLQWAPGGLRMVVFNACRSAEHARAAAEFADVAIGMETSIHDHSAKAWAGQFYSSLAYGLPIAHAVRQATSHARAVTGGAKSLGEPRLYEHAGVDAEATVLVNPEDD